MNNGKLERVNRNWENVYLRDGRKKSPAFFNLPRYVHILSKVHNSRRNKIVPFFSEFTIFLANFDVLWKVEKCRKKNSWSQIKCLSVWVTFQMQRNTKPFAAHCQFFRVVNLLYSFLILWTKYLTCVYLSFVSSTHCFIKNLPSYPPISFRSSS